MADLQDRKLTFELSRGADRGHQESNAGPIGIEGTCPTMLATQETRMDQNTRIDMTQIADLDPATSGIPVPPPRRKPKLPGQEAVLESTLRFYTDMNLPESPVIRDLLDFKSKPHLRLSIVGKPKFASVRPSTQFTIASGPSVSAGAVGSLGLAGGMYYSNLPELGFFRSFNFGVVTNFSASAVWQVLIMFGTPSIVLAGTTVAIGVNVSLGSVGAVPVTGGGFVLALVSPVGTFDYVGFGYQLGAGSSVLPFDFTLTKSVTAITPIL
jgi:hypothetical protein